jgi:hypothetical protein
MPKKLIFNQAWIYRSLLLLVGDRLFSKPYINPPPTTCESGRVYKIINFRQLGLVKPAATAIFSYRLNVKIPILVGAGFTNNIGRQLTIYINPPPPTCESGRVYEIVNFRQLGLVKPAATAIFSYRLNVKIPILVGAGFTNNIGRQLTIYINPPPPNLWIGTGL